MKVNPKHSYLPHLCAFSAIIVFSYNVVLKRSSSSGADWLEPAVGTFDGGRRLTVKEYTEQRIAEVFKDTWPECVKDHMTAVQCKEFIDEQILSTFTERDKYIRVIIRGKRSKKDSWYNTVVIPMNDDDMAAGLNGDGVVEYFEEWDGSGQEALPEQQIDIPPVLAYETEIGAKPLITDTTSPDYVPQADPTSEEFEPLILEDEPILVQGATVDGALDHSDMNPIAGGVVIDPNKPNTPEGDAKLEAAVKEAKEAKNPDDPNGGAGGLVEGPRVLEPFDCKGLTGHNCCLMIKLKVRDSDKHGNAIQCQLVYEEGSNKERFWLNSRGKKVFVWANHNEFVSKIPKIVGDWPKDSSGFDQWLLEGGDPTPGGLTFQ